MHPDLESVVAADEEARARVANAERRQESALAAARVECDAAVASRRAEAAAQLDGEIHAITREGEARAAEARTRNADYLRLLGEAGDRAFDQAVEQYTRIVLRP